VLGTFNRIKRDFCAVGVNAHVCVFGPSTREDAIFALSV